MVKWTRGELGAIVSEGDAERALEVVGYLDERGPSVIDWDDDRIPCSDCQRLEGHSDRCSARQMGEIVGEDRASRDTDIDELRVGQ